MSKGAHPKHPRCPGCGKAMYKAAVKGTQVKKSDPWAFCRNAKCKLCGMNQAADDQDTERWRVAAAKARENLPKAKPKKQSKAKPPPAPEPENNKKLTEPLSSPGDEPEAVHKARFRIREVLRKALAGTDATPTTVGITLALVSQETGNHAAANAIIDEYKLTDLLGIQKQEARDGKA